MDFFYVLDGENGESAWYLPNEFDQVCVCAFVCVCAHVHACVSVCIERSHMESGGDEIMLAVEKCATAVQRLERSSYRPLFLSYFQLS